VKLSQGLFANPSLTLKAPLARNPPPTMLEGATALEATDRELELLERFPSSTTTWSVVSLDRL